LTKKLGRRRNTPCCAAAGEGQNRLRVTAVPSPGYLSRSNRTEKAQSCFLPAIRFGAEFGRSLAPERERIDSYPVSQPAGKTIVIPGLKLAWEHELQISKPGYAEFGTAQFPNAPRAGHNSSSEAEVPETPRTPHDVAS